MSKSRKQNKNRKTRKKQNRNRKTRRKQNRKTLKGGAHIFREGYNHLKHEIAKKKKKITDIVRIIIFNAKKEAVTKSFGRWKGRDHTRNMCIITFDNNYNYLVTFHNLFGANKIHSAYKFPNNINLTVFNEDDWEWNIPTGNNKNLYTLNKIDTVYPVIIKLTSEIPNGTIILKNIKKPTIRASDVEESIQSLFNSDAEDQWKQQTGVLTPEVEPTPDGDALVERQMSSSMRNIEKYVQQVRNTPNGEYVPFTPFLI